jgi:hypothetical protein
VGETRDHVVPAAGIPLFFHIMVIYMTVSYTASRRVLETSSSKRLGSDNGYAQKHTKNDALLAISGGLTKKLTILSVIMIVIYPGYRET